MTEQIPDRIKRLIWIRHIKGESPTRICKKLGISRTSYYSIIRDTESQDPDISLMRTLAVNLRKNGLDTRKYAKSLRISNLLEQFGIIPRTGELLMEGLLVACHKENWKPIQAVKTLKLFADSADEFGHTLSEHEAYWRKLHHQDLDRKKEIEQAEEELKKFIETHEIVKDNLKLFMEPKGLTELDIQKWSEASKYKQKYEDLKKDLHLARQGKALDPNEVKKLNDKLVVAISEEEILDKLEEIRMHLSTYHSLFRKPLSDTKKLKDSQSLHIDSSIAQKLAKAYPEHQYELSRSKDFIDQDSDNGK
jgi:hypothetical protein